MAASDGRRLRSTRRGRRAQLAAIAADLFHRHGYHNVGVDEIAAAAGLTGPAVYRHFASKQDILGHVVVDGLDSFAAGVAATVDAWDGSSDGDLLHTVVASASRLAIERRELGALWRREGRNLPATDRAALVMRARQATQFGVNLIRGVRPPLSPEDADLLCSAAMSVWGSLSDHHVALPRARFEALLSELVLAVMLADTVPVSVPGPPPLRPQQPGSQQPGSQPPGSQPPGSQPPGSQQPRREQLLTLAARMFREHGYHGVTMEDIGAAAGISGPSIYRHYAGKADLLLAMCARVRERLLAGVDAALQPDHQPRPALHELTTSFVHTVLEHRDLVAAYLMEGHNLPDRPRTELRRQQRHYLDQWVRLLVGIDPIMDGKPARIRVHAAVTIVNDLARAGRFAARPHLADELIALALAVLVPRPAGPPHM
ncbi:MAG TPA: TetR/AcrR family transcriptional regulator [Pseudonocardiaceae bacterium]